MSLVISCLCLHCIELQAGANGDVNVLYDHCRQVPPVNVDVYADIDVLCDAGSC